jgi:hypothetical protein
MTVGNCINIPEELVIPGWVLLLLLLLLLLLSI